MAAAFRPGSWKRSKIGIDRDSNFSWRLEMALTAAHIAPLVALIAGILIVPFGVPNPRLQAKRRGDEVALCDDID
jgi:hypothetical protein